MSLVSENHIWGRPTPDTEPAGEAFPRTLRELWRARSQDEMLVERLRADCAELAQLVDDRPLTEGEIRYEVRMAELRSQLQLVLTGVAPQRAASEPEE